ncbi:MAG: zinc ribbon domain-containing protein [Muribaculaceae bacterium]|nr:zinc ribbon domain-containing protein [Muribaculaceae bacterium]
MALIECNECGTQVSDKASKCPKCGNPMKPSSSERAKTFFKSKLFIGIICSLIGLAGILLAFLCIGFRPEYEICDGLTNDFIYDFDINRMSLLDWALGTDYSKLYVSETYSVGQHWLLVIIGIIFLCIAMKMFFSELNKWILVGLTLVTISFTVLNIRSKSLPVETKLKNIQARVETYINSPEYQADLLELEKEKARKKKVDAGKELLTQELKGCYSNDVSLIGMPDSIITGYCNELNKLSIKTWNIPLNGLDLKVYQANYENEYGNRTIDRFYVFFKEDKPIKYAKEDFIREGSELKMLFLMLRDFE